MTDDYGLAIDTGGYGLTMDMQCRIAESEMMEKRELSVKKI